MAVYGCGFNRSMQQLDRLSPQPVADVDGNQAS